MKFKATLLFPLARKDMTSPADDDYDDDGDDRL